MRTNDADACNSVILVDFNNPTDPIFFKKRKTMTVKVKSL